MAWIDPPRVLLVDDDDVVRRALARALSHDFQVTQASGGNAAVQLLTREAFDAVVTDLQMPDLCGDEIVAWLGLHRPPLADRVVVITGGPAPDKVAWLDAFDPPRVVRKPCSIGALSAAIRHVLGGSVP